MKQRVLVTGASRGIGRAIAIELGRRGHALCLNYKSDRASAEATLAAVAAAGGEAKLAQFDIGDREATRGALERELGEFGAFWGVVCNAGIAADAPFPALDGAAWDRVVHTNLDGFYNVLQPLVMPMIQLREGGRIVTLSSISGVVGNRGQVNYAASKAGIIGATKSLALELAKRKITVNCVAPGLIETDMTSALPLDQVIERIPMRRLGKAEEVASAVAYLFSDGAAYVTGQVLSINGGMA